MEEKAAAEEQTARLSALNSPISAERTYLAGEKEALARDTIKRYQLYEIETFHNDW